MSKGKYVTKELVQKVKQFYGKSNGFTHKEIADYCGTSSTTVGEILKGTYDHLLYDSEKLQNDQLHELLILANGMDENLDLILDVLNVIAERIGAGNDSQKN